MIIPTLILGFIAIGLLIFGHKNGVHIQGLKNGFTMTIQILPLLFFSFIIAGMIQVLVSPDALLKWIGPESGVKGIFLGTLRCRLTLKTCAVPGIQQINTDANSATLHLHRLFATLYFFNYVDVACIIENAVFV